MNLRMQQLLAMATQSSTATTGTDAHVDQEIFASLIVQECKNIVNQEYYAENSKEQNPQDTRSVAIHVGRKSGMITCLNAIQQHMVSQ